MKKAELLKQIDESIKDNEVGNVIIMDDNKWRWFKNGDDENTCKLLKFMLQIEYRSGTLIFIPDKINKFGQPGNCNRNGEG